MHNLKIVPELHFNNKKIADYLKQKRLDAKLSLEQVVEFAELENIETLVNYELGFVSIPLNELYALSNVLNIVPSELLNLINQN